MRRVLFVDDESNILHGLRRMLRSMRAEWDMHFAEGAEAALELLGRMAFDVVVSDMRMPGMDGAALLQKVRQRDAGVIRIVLSGQTDKEAVIRSTGVAHQFLSKPCDPKDLKSSIDRACDLRILMDDRSIRRIIGGISSLPSLPDIYAELTAEIASEDMSLARVGEIVSRDLALSAKILQLVNSAFFGLPRHTESVAQAVSFLGAEVVRSLALSTSVFQAFEGDVDRFQFKHLWNHSVAVGAVAAAIARAEGEPKATAEDALQAGMLHDVGRLILAAGLPNRYHETIDRADADGQPIWQVERTVFGCDHARIGGYLLGLWGLPDSIVEAVVYHHDPLASHVRSQGFSALLAVNVANRLVALDPADADRGCDELDALRSGDDDSARLDAWLDIARRHGIHTQET